MNYQLLFHLVFKCNLIKTIWFNFKMLPFSQAKRLPIFVYRRVCFRDLTGNIEINNVKPGMIRIGYSSRYVVTSVPKSVWIIRGKIVFNGPVHFYQGTYILVSNNALLTFGSGWNMLGSGSKIMCFENISMGRRVAIAWDCQIYDTGFHYIQNINDDTCKSLTKSITIGDHVWVGNRTTISKGAVIPNETIIASNSLVNKDISAEGSYCLFAGSPIRLVKRNIRRVWDESRQAELDQIFGYHRTHL